MKTKITQEQIEKLKESNIRMRQKAENLNRKFKYELKTSVKTAIIAAFGFLIALQWKELITEIVNKIASESPVQGNLITTGIVTIICVLGIMVTTELLSTKEIK